MKTPQQFWITEFKNQFDVWQVFHAFRNKEKAISDAGRKGQVIHVIEYSAFEAAQAEIEKLKAELDLASGTYYYRKRKQYEQQLEAAQAEIELTTKNLNAFMDKDIANRTKLSELNQQLESAKSEIRQVTMNRDSLYQDSLKLMDELNSERAKSKKLKEQRDAILSEYGNSGCFETGFNRASEWVDMEIEKYDSQIAEYNKGDK